MNTIEGKVALVTGGSRGIGAAIALKLASEGANVALTYQREKEAAAAVVAEIEKAGRWGLAVEADCADVTAVTGAVDEAVTVLGRLDILVNNAGVFVLGQIHDLGLDDFERTMAVNVRAPFVAAQAAARHLPHGGRIISIGSNVAERAAFPGLSLYAMSKTALIGMTKGLARDLGHKGITVNLIHPGPTDTDANPADQPNADAIRGLTAVGRYAAPSEIASTVAYLAGPDASYITGTTISVDGGWAI